MTYFILGFLGVLLVIVCVDLWCALQKDWDTECNEGQCKGHCKHAVCPSPWECGRGNV